MHIFNYTIIIIRVFSKCPRNNQRNLDNNTCPFGYVISADNRIVLQCPSITNDGRVHPAAREREVNYNHSK